MKKFIGCEIRHLDEDELVDAAKTACAVNPLNSPSLVMAEAAALTPLHIAVLTSKYWGGGGVHLTVGFMEATSDALAAKIVSFMNQWSKTANIQFTLGASNPLVRISRRAGGYWSYLGTDILHIPKDQPTMNLEGFGNTTPDSEFMRVICHETFHTCGAPHEHMRKELVQLLDPAKTIAYFGKTQGWSAQEVQQQILTPLNESSLLSTPVDQDSIMCYQIPGQCTRDGQPIRGGVVINQSDYDFAARIYPKPTVPVPPPRPPWEPPANTYTVIIEAETPIKVTQKGP